MYIISNNITTRKPAIARLFNVARDNDWNPQKPPAAFLKELAKQCAEAGADGLEIDIQQHNLPPEAMEFAVNVIQQEIDCQICLSTNNYEAMEAGLKACKRFPIANYVSFEEEKLRKMLPLIAKSGAEVILLVSDPARPAEAQEMIEQAAVLVGAANEEGIPNDHIIIDPGLFHVTIEQGQRHMVQVMEFLQALPEAFDPPVRSTCWLGNSSAGAPVRLRPVIETSLLAMLAGTGLSSAFLDVLRKENMRTVRLIKIFRNREIYTDSDVKL